jgi:peptidoglycan/LPS O-acetylase OafA/YrhL
MFRWLNTAPMQYLGSVSYTVYLVHFSVLFWLMEHYPALGGFGTGVLGALITLAIAEPMRRWVEQPCARLRQRLHREWILPKVARPLQTVNPR